jgi:hypothetical protein
MMILLNNHKLFLSKTLSLFKVSRRFVGSGKKIAEKIIGHGPKLLQILEKKVVDVVPELVPEVTVKSASTFTPQGSPDSFSPTAILTPTTSSSAIRHGGNVLSAPIHRTFTSLNVPNNQTVPYTHARSYATITQNA